MRQFELIVFDWDGTVVDSEGRIVNCIQKAATVLGLPARPVARIRATIGLALNEAVERLYPGIDENVVMRFVSAYRREFLTDGRPPATLFPGAANAVKELLGNGYRTAIATGKSRLGLDRELQETGFVSIISDSRCADETRSKPHPEMLLQLTSALKVSANATLMVGDTTYDMDMARAAGVSAVGVSCGVHATRALVETGALDVIPSLFELPAWLNRYERANSRTT